MPVAIKRWGNSQGVVIPALLIKQLNLTNGQELEIEARDGAIVLTPVRTKERRYTLEELCAQCDMDAPMQTEAEIWGTDAPVGKEVW